MSGVRQAPPGWHDAVVPRRRSRYDRRRMARLIEPVGHRAKNFADADSWDREQLARTSLDERLRIAEMLRRRVYGDHAPDVRESEQRR